MVHLKLSAIEESEWPLFVYVVEQRLPRKLKRARCAGPLGTECCRLVHSIPEALARTPLKKTLRRQQAARLMILASGSD